MTNLIEQNMTVLVTPSSRYNGNAYDEVYVRTTILADGELKDKYYVPSGESLPPAALNLIKANNLEFRPYRAEDLLQGTENIQESAKTGDPVDTVSDSAKLILLSALKERTLEEVAQIGTKRVYDLTYTYKLFPSPDGKFRFHVRLPFDGITMANGVLKLTVVTPDLAIVDPAETKGTDDQQKEIQETITKLQTTGKSVTEFTYRRDPDFVVAYSYPAGSEWK